MSSPNVSFTSIPANLRRPQVAIEENTSNALQGLTAQNDAIVIIAQKTSSGTAAVNVPTKVFSTADSALYFGQGSVADLTVKAAFAANPNINLSVVAVAEPAGAGATGMIYIPSAATTAGTLNVWIGDQNIQIPYNSGDANYTIAQALYTGIYNVQSTLPVTAGSGATGVVGLQAKNTGVVGNYIPVTASTSGGLTVTATEPSGASSIPAFGDKDTPASPLGAIAGAGYSIIVNTVPVGSAVSDPLLATKTLVNYVSGPLEQRPAIQVAAYTDQIGNFAAVETLAGTNLNDGRTTLAYMSYASGNLAKSEEYKLAGAYAAILASQPDPAIPYDGLTLASIAAPAIPDRFTNTQQESLLNNGVTPLAVVPGEEVAIVRAISTYVTNSSSIPDPTLLDINTIRTLDYVRAQIRTRLSLRFQRAKLSTLTPARIKNQIIDVLYLLQSAEIVQNVDIYKSGIFVEQDLSDVNRIDCKIPSNIVSGLHVIAAVIDLILGL